MACIYYVNVHYIVVCYLVPGEFRQRKIPDVYARIVKKPRLVKVLESMKISTRQSEEVAASLQGPVPVPSGHLPLTETTGTLGWRDPMLTSAGSSNDKCNVLHRV